MGFLHKNTKLHFRYAWNRWDYIKILGKEARGPEVLKENKRITRKRSELDQIKLKFLNQKLVTKINSRITFTINKFSKAIKQFALIELLRKVKDKAYLLNLSINHFQKIRTQSWSNPHHPPDLRHKQMFSIFTLLISQFNHHDWNDRTTLRKIVPIKVQVHRTLFQIHTTHFLH